MSMKAAISFVLASCYTNFLPSIGIDDNWEDPDEGDFEADEDPDDQILRRTRESLTKIFSTVYKDQDFEDQLEEDADLNHSSLDFLKNLLPKINIGELLIPRRLKRRIVADIDGCDTPPIEKFLDKYLKEEGE